LYYGGEAKNSGFPRLLPHMCHRSHNHSHFVKHFTKWLQLKKSNFTKVATATAVLRIRNPDKGALVPALASFFSGVLWKVRLGAWIYPPFFSNSIEHATRLGRQAPSEAGPPLERLSPNQARPTHRGHHIFSGGPSYPRRTRRSQQPHTTSTP
jgi:hypothetical protein